jgi:transposase
MIPIPSGVRVWITTGHTDMRRGMNSLALLVQEAFKRDPHGGDLYVFRGKSGKLIKILRAGASSLISRGSVRCRCGRGGEAYRCSVRHRT